VVLHGCETLPLTLREEHRLKEFENRMVRRIFGPKRDEVIGGWKNCIMRSFISRTLRQNEQVKEDEMGKEYSTDGEKRSARRILVRKPEGKRPLGRPRRRYS
jgi:hypothetical protein